jgi:hypothetical protein
MSHEPTFAPELLVAALNGAGSRYVVVGGLAVGAHGVVRATRDLDIVCARQPENMDRVAECLAALGAEHPVEGTLSGASLSRPASFKLRTRHGEVQVLNRMPGIPPFDALEAERILVRISSDALAPVCSLEHLRAMKRAAGRPRDLADLAELDELHADR